ncbi:MAG: 4Fe-4S dicluster domain-containing protein [bacterium]
MTGSRRTFLKQAGVLTGLAVCGNASTVLAARRDGKVQEDATDQYGVLVDTTRCVGCRRCEKACNEINTELPSKSAEFFQDQKVLEQRRRMDDSAYTVVNRYCSSKDPAKTVHSKFQCMHCRNAACVSACIVGALTRDATGAILYDPWKCIGCRYCMVACPFQVPGYEYSNAFTPQVRKCHFCHQTRLSKGQPAACVQACPMEVMTFGKRSKLLDIAKRRIREHSGRYIPHIYGENELGGTAWMYLSSIPFQEIDLPKFGYHPTPGYTEPIQHAIFKWFLPPLGVFAALGGIWWYLSARGKTRQEVVAGK